MQNWGETIALAILQGLTEFLPVSSSGHLEGWKRISDSELRGDITLDVLLHFATLLAVLIVYRGEVKRLLGGLFRSGPARRDLGLVFVGTIPAGLVGLFAHDAIESFSLSVPVLLPICWGACGLALLSSKGALQRPEEGEPAGDSFAAAGISLRGAIWIGAWQAVALLPGVSRSGITIVAALWFGVRREAAARFSFLIAAPLIAGASILELPEIFSGEGGVQLSASLLVGFVTAFLVGWGALILLLRLLQGGRLYLWGFYLLALAAFFSIRLALGSGS